MPEKQGQIVSGVVCRSDFSAEFYNAGKFVQFCARFERIRCAQTPCAEHFVPVSQRQLPSHQSEEIAVKKPSMKNLYVVAMLAATLAGGTLESASAQSASKTGIKNVVLVHGAFADGSGWEAVADILKKDGYTVSVVQHPETSYAEDIKFTKAVIDRQSGPVVLVGHSYGGSVITEAGNNPKVAALVYIAAFALDTGESCATIETTLPPATKGIKSTADGYFYIDPAVFHADFAADVPVAKAEFMALSQVLISGDSFTHAVTNPAWKSKPTWYLVATADRSINPDQERMMAKRAHAKTIEVNSSHVAYISHPKETAKLIEEAAASAPANQ
jgi:pimeloyl-ACP methyl ester carboxylesterase